jgi:hypothetical protein
MTLRIAAMTKPEISIQTVLPPYEKILTPIFYLVTALAEPGATQ